MFSWDLLIKQARTCITKQAWESFFKKYKETIISSKSSKHLTELYKILSTDPQSLQYSPEIWASLLSGCLSCWNLELGKQISEYCKKCSSEKIAIQAAKIYKEGGEPSRAREIAARALRLKDISIEDKIQLEMIICNAYVEEDKKKVAVRILNKMLSSFGKANLSKQTKSEFLLNIARTQFFLGRYVEAAEAFKQGYEIASCLNDWDTAATASYNAASSFFNAGENWHDKAFNLVEECRRICETHNIFTPLSHVEALYGHNDYWHGNLASAREHYKRAHKYLPEKEKSWRTLHILSMLSLIYLRTGQYGLAKKFGQQTLNLAELDQSYRFKSRYNTLNAELKWISSDFDASQKLLRQSAQKLQITGITTLEELSTFGRYCYQAGWLNEDFYPSKVTINEQLKKNTGEWIEYKISLGAFNLNKNHFEKAENYFKSSISMAKNYDDKYHLCEALLGLVQVYFRQQKPVSIIEPLVRKLEVAVAKIVETPINSEVKIVQAALAYRQGDFQRCSAFLKTAAKSNRLAVEDKFALDSWISAIDGKSPRITSKLHLNLLANITKSYFAPSLSYLGEKQFVISNIYHVNLSRYPAIADLLKYLLEKNNFSAAPEEIQQNVWHQSLATQGWRQKIRNTIMRLRDFFPYTIAPLIIHQEEISLFSQAINIIPIIHKNVSPKDEILRLLNDSPMSTKFLSNRINISATTTKRIIRDLQQENKIIKIKKGRQIYYGTVKEKSSILDKTP